jgi:hypothetical protein
MPRRGCRLVCVAATAGLYLWQCYAFACIAYGLFKILRMVTKGACHLYMALPRISDWDMGIGGGASGSAEEQVTGRLGDVFSFHCMVSKDYDCVDKGLGWALGWAMTRLLHRRRATRAPRRTTPDS